VRRAPKPGALWIFSGGSMHKKQRGITFIGWLFLIIPIAIVVYAGIRVAPLYMTYGKIVRVMDQIEKEGSASDSQRVVYVAIEKRLDIEGIEFPTVKEFSIRRDGQSWMVEIDYEEPAPLFANLSLNARFVKSVRLGEAP
jgi:hypothetical protein